MKCKDCAIYKDEWCSIMSDSPDPDLERDCGHFIQAQRWISRFNRTPKLRECVLCAFNNRKIEISWMNSEDHFMCEDIYGRVTHWMPLPEPPEVSE